MRFFERTRALKEKKRESFIDQLPQTGEQRIEPIFNRRENFLKEEYYLIRFELVRKAREAGTMFDVKLFLPKSTRCSMESFSLPRSHFQSQRRGVMLSRALNESS